MTTFGLRIYSFVDFCLNRLQGITKASSTMTNAFGVAKDIISFEEEGMFQFMHIGVCA